MSRYSKTIAAVHSWRDPDAAKLYGTESYYSVSLVDSEGNEITCIGGDESLADAWEIATEAADEHGVDAVEFAHPYETEKVTDRYTPDESEDEDEESEDESNKSLDECVSALAAEGYDVSAASNEDRLIVAVNDDGDGDESELDAIREIVKQYGCKADWTGDGNTDASGVSTSDVAIERA